MNWFRNLLFKLGIDITPRKELYASISDLQNEIETLNKEAEILKYRLEEITNERNIKDQYIWDLEDEIRMLKGCCHEDDYIESY